MMENLESNQSTIQKAIEFLNLHQDEYIVSKMLFADSFEMRTRAMIWLKEPEKFFPITDQRCALSIPELEDMLVKSQRDYPEGKFVFDIRKSGEIHLVFDIKTPMEDQRDKPYKTYTKEEIEGFPEHVKEHYEGCKTVKHDRNHKAVYVNIQLDQKREWFLRVYFDDMSGQFKKYILDYEGMVYESHYEFKDEESIRKLLYQAGDEEKHLDELFIRYIYNHSGNELTEIIKPYITAQYHYD